MSSPEPAVRDCVIVGAGLAGLTAAIALRHKGRSVAVFEARDRVGGRVETVQMANGASIDLGGQWIADTHTRMLALVEKHHLQLAETSSGEVTVKLRGVVTTVPGQDEIEASLNPFEIADLGQGLARFRRLAQRYRSDRAWAADNEQWLGQLLTRWAHSNLRTPGGQNWFRRVFEGAFGVAFTTVTLAEGLQRATSGVDMESLVAVNGGVNQRRILGGAQQLCDALAADIGEDLHLNSAVTAIETGDDRVTLTLAEGSTVQARHAIVTLPPKLATALAYTPPLGDWRHDLASRVPAGSVVKAVAAYERPWWRDAGFSGQMGADEGPVRVLFDISEDEGVGILTGFFGADGRTMEGPDLVGQRRQALADTVTAAFGEGPEMLEYRERDWRAEEFTGGCHGAHFSPGVWTASGPALAQPHGQVHFAGAEFALKFNGYLEGAVRSGQDAATAVLKQLG